MKVGSLCTGYGGLEMGLRAVLPAAELAWVADNDKAASALLEVRYPGTPNLGDIKVIDWSTVESVDILTAGYPCQPFSEAGKRRDNGDERDLTEYVLEAICILQPKIVILENVPGHRRRGFGRVLAGLSALGYDVRWHSVRADEAGAPHKRERLFILAYPRGSGRETWARLCESNPKRFGWGRPGDEDGQTPTHALGDRWHEGQPESEEQQWVTPLAWSGNQADADPNRSPGDGRSEVQERDQVGGTPALRTGYIDWREYEPAISRWERVTGRLAPNPTEIGPRGNVRLSAHFVEWMMGPPKGWVCDVLSVRNTQIARLGNGVVPQQAELAIDGLLRELEWSL